jgi:hypothetical protein
MRLDRLFALASFTFLGFPVLAQQTSAPAPTGDPQALALLQKSLGAMAGGTLPSDVTLTGTANWLASGNETGTATLTAMSPAYSKVVLNLPSGTRTEIRNPAGTPLPGVIPANAPASAQGPQLVGAWSGSDGVLHPVKFNNILADPTWFCPLFTLSRLATGPYTLSYIGQGTVNGLSSLHVSAVLQFPELANAGAVGKAIQHLSQIDIYLDPNTSLPIAVAFNTHPDNSATIDVPNTIQFSNYQSTDGIQIPMRVQKYVDNGITLDLQFTSAAVNSGLSAGQFQLQ